MWLLAEKDNSTYKRVGIGEKDRDRKPLNLLTQAIVGVPASVVPLPWQLTKADDVTAGFR